MHILHIFFTIRRGLWPLACKTGSAAAWPLTTTATTTATTTTITTTATATATAGCGSRQVAVAPG